MPFFGTGISRLASNAFGPYNMAASPSARNAMHLTGSDGSTSAAVRNICTVSSVNAFVPHINSNPSNLIPSRRTPADACATAGRTSDCMTASVACAGSLDDDELFAVSKSEEAMKSACVSA